MPDESVPQSMAAKIDEVYKDTKKQNERLADIHKLLAGTLERPQDGVVARLWRQESILKDHLEWHEKQKKTATWWQKQIIGMLFGIGATATGAYLISKWHLG